MSHRRAVILMLLVTLLWSTAGVVTRHLQDVRSFELTFWRSAFTLVFLSMVLGWQRGPALFRQLLLAPNLVRFSGLCWAVMFTAFMLALKLTSVGNVLVTMALAPLLTALFSRLFLHHKLPLRTWAAILLGSAGLAWMFSQQLDTHANLQGIAVALCVPLATATNWCLLQHAGQAPKAKHSDMPLALLLGALLSAVATLPLALPLQASVHDLSWLAGLGLFQLTLPCLLVVRLSRVLSGAELSLLGLLEVIFGVLWAWLGAGEDPSSSTLVGGAMVLAALIGNELLARKITSHAAMPIVSTPNSRSQA